MNHGCLATLDADRLMPAPRHKVPSLALVMRTALSNGISRISLPLQMVRGHGFNASYFHAPHSFHLSNIQWAMTGVQIDGCALHYLPWKLR